MLERLLANWPLRLLSIALAFAIWVFVTGEKQIVQDFSVPLDIRLPESRILTEAPPNTVTVRLRGAESLLRRLDRAPMEISVNLEDPPPGIQDVQLSESDVDVPRGVEVDFIDPDRVSLSVDRRLRRELIVEPIFLGQPPEGYAFYGVQVLPEKLFVEGPETEVAALEKLSTNPIRLDMRTRPFSLRVQAVPDGRAVRVVDALEVEVRVVVDGAPVERTFENLAVELVGQVYESVVSPAALDATLSGPPSLIERLQPSQIRLVADITGLTPQARPHSVNVIFDLIDVPIEEMNWVSLKSISRREIAVRVSDRRANR